MSDNPTGRRDRGEENQPGRPSPGKGIFVTGTDTDVGKTVAAAALLVLLRSAGVDAVPMKPVQTGGIRRVDAGCGERWTSSDLDFCLQMAGLEVGAEEYRAMAPYIYEPACSPHLAADKSCLAISFRVIADAFASLLKHHECVVVEGAGGVLVPVGQDRSMLDLMVHLGLPVVLAARPSLGTLNHSLLSIRELRRAGLTVLGVVFCETQATQWGEIENDNRRTIERLGDTRILGRIPYMPALADGTLTPEAFRSTGTKEVHLPGI